jgi:hypothetical protein
MPFFKNKEQEGKTGPTYGLVPVAVWGYKESVEGQYGRNNMYSCIKMEKWDLLKLV